VIFYLVLQKFQESAAELLKSRNDNLPNVGELLTRAKSELEVFTSKVLFSC